MKHLLLIMVKFQFHVKNICTDLLVVVFTSSCPGELDLVCFAISSEMLISDSNENTKNTTQKVKRMFSWKEQVIIINGFK